MLRTITAAVLLAAAPVHPSASRHAHGCRTRRCDVHVGRAWWRRHHPQPPPAHAVASWYDDAPGTASGFHASYGFATCGDEGPCLPFHTRVRFCYHGRCVIAEADDHGPYVPGSGRWFDLGASTAQALGFDGVATVMYTVL